MAFSYTITKHYNIEGVLKKVYGTFTNTGGSTGGDIVTNLKNILSVELQHTGASVVASAPVVNETLPLNNTGGTVTIVTVADTSGTFVVTGS